MPRDGARIVELRLEDNFIEALYALRKMLPKDADCLVSVGELKTCMCQGVKVYLNCSWVHLDSETLGKPETNVVSQKSKAYAYII